jgi:hypothetical protein
MTVNITLTEQLRKLPYFADFKEESVDVPAKPFLREILDQTLDMASLSIEELCACIETCIYFGLETAQLTQELLWKIGADSASFDQWFSKQEDQWSLKSGLSVPLEQELKTALGKSIDRACLIKLGIRCIYPTCLEILIQGNSRLLQWAYTLGKTGSPWSQEESIIANKGGWTYYMKRSDKGFLSWDQLATSLAAAYGHLECLKFLHEQGCPWDERTVLNATRNGHLECLKYLHEQGCPYYGIIAGYVAKNGHQECIEYLRKLGALI